MSRPEALLRAALVGLLALLLGPGLVAATPARAETADEARAKARHAAAVVDRLKPQVDAALAAYQASLKGLAQDVGDSVRAQQEADSAQLQHAQQTLLADQRVRAFYMAGGQPGILASVLEASSPTELVQRMGNVGRVFDADQAASQDSWLALDSAQAVAAAADSAADATVSTVGDTQRKLRRLERLLDEAQAALDALDSRARHLEEAERAAAALAAARSAADSARWDAAGTATARGIPVTYLALYRAAAKTCAGLPWPVLAAIGQVESGHGRNTNDSYAGAQGPMQFLPSTFAAYAVDGDHDGRTDIRNPADAIFTAAHYLCANNAGRDADGLRKSIWRYNHANWYVAMVLRIAAQIADRFGEPAVPPYEPVV